MISFFEDNSSGLSSIRLAFLLWCAGVLLIWGYTSFAKAEIQPIDNSVVTVLLGLGTTKTIQRFGEKSEEK